MIISKRPALWIFICKRLVPLGDHLQPRKGHEKCIFETLHNEIKCVLSIRKSNFNWKKWVKIFTFAYGLGRGSWAPPPPYSQPDRKISSFLTPSLTICVWYPACSPTVEPGKDFQKKTDSRTQMALTQKQKEILWWVQRVKWSLHIAQQTPRWQKFG